MIRKIHIENFMAHKATSIELAPGVTVVTGPNNIGKSAFVEAIRHLVYNPPPKNIIRHGAKKALVRLELDSGESITWQRQDKNASYAIQEPGQDPEEYHKFGRDVPLDVRHLLRLEMVETDTEAIDIHLGNQRQPIFLLDRPGSHAAGFFAASTEADYLLKMQQLLKGKIEQAKRDGKRLDAELISLTRQLQQYEPLIELDAEIIQAEAGYAAILETARQLPLLNDCIGRLQHTQVHLNRTRQSAAILNTLEGPPALQDITGLALVIGELADKTRQHRREAARTAAITELTPPPALEATAPLESLLVQSQTTLSRYTAHQARSRILAALTPPPETDEVKKLHDLALTYQDTLARQASLRRRQTVLIPLTEPPHLEATAALEDLIVQMRREQSHRVNLDQTAHLLSGLQSPPETVNLVDLENSLNALGGATAALARQQASLAELTRHLEQKKTEIQDYLDATGLCPLCGSPLDLEHFLESRHA